MSCSSQALSARTVGQAAAKGPLGQQEPPQPLSGRSGRHVSQCVPNQGQPLRLGQPQRLLLQRLQICLQVHSTGLEHLLLEGAGLSRLFTAAGIRVSSGQTSPCAPNQGNHFIQTSLKGLCCSGCRSALQMHRTRLEHFILKGADCHNFPAKLGSWVSSRQVSPCVPCQGQPLHSFWSASKASVAAVADLPVHGTLQENSCTCFSAHFFDSHLCIKQA